MTDSEITYEQIMAMQENFKKYGAKKPRVLIEQIPEELVQELQKQLDEDFLV